MHVYAVGNLHAIGHKHNHAHLNTNIINCRANSIIVVCLSLMGGQTIGLRETSSCISGYSIAEPTEYSLS